jgi:hypothetical protein
LNLRFCRLNDDILIDLNKWRKITLRLSRAAAWIK